MSLFSAAGLEPEAPQPAANQPLADRLRPQKLAEVAGQDHIVGPNGALTRLLGGRTLGSLIFWGPPGTGKTTVARLLAGETKLAFVQISAIFSGVADLKKVFEEARRRRQMGQGTLLFVDEIHRFNRAQQDGFLPVMEDGTITLIGATTENPSFELNSALLSRARVMTFKALDADAIERLLHRAEAIDNRKLPLDADARAALIRMGDGDGRAALTLAEELWRAAGPGEVFDTKSLAEIVQRRAPIYDKAQEGHYNLISALHKAVRGSDPDAALYYLARMFDGGEDPLFIARRVVRMAVEDIGLADPQAPGPRQCREGCLRLSRLAGGRTGDRPSRDLCRDGAEVERGLCRLQKRDAARARERLTHAAEGDPERLDQVHEERRLRR